MFSRELYKLLYKLTVSVQYQYQFCFVTISHQTKCFKTFNLAIFDKTFQASEQDIHRKVKKQKTKKIVPIWLIFYSISIIIPNHLFYMENETLFWNHNWKDKFFRFPQKPHSSFKFNRYTGKKCETAWIFMPKRKRNLFINQFVSK